MDDLQFVERLIRGEARAWGQFLDQHGPAVAEAARFTLRRVLGTVREGDVDNVVQAVLLALCDKGFHRLKLYQGSASLNTWLTSVTCRYALNHVRTEKRKGSLRLGSLDDSAGEIPDPAALLPPGLEDRERLHGALERLPPRERLILKLFYFDGLSYRAIAEVLRIPVNSVSPFLARAREAFKKQVEAP
jgi:RNA polymerase sigma-70 factor (ECF subfamily)